MGKYTDNDLKAVGWFKGGYTLMTSGLYEEAIEAFNEAINLDPNIAGFYTMRGYAYSKVEKFREALEDFNKAIELDPEDAQNYSFRGRRVWNHRQSGSCSGKHQGSGSNG